jgi:hypothetical protein
MSLRPTSRAAQPPPPQGKRGFDATFSTPPKTPRSKSSHRGSLSTAHSRRSQESVAQWARLALENAYYASNQVKALKIELGNKIRSRGWAGLYARRGPPAGRHKNAAKGLFEMGRGIHVLENILASRIQKLNIFFMRRLEIGLPIINASY